MTMRHPHYFFFSRSTNCNILGEVKGNGKMHFFEEEGNGGQEEEMESDLSVWLAFNLAPKAFT